MRYDPDSALSAAEIVNSYSEEDLANLIYRYGEEPRSRAVARAIVRSRPVQSTGALAEIVIHSVGIRRRQKINPATRTFQAIRIAVNDELGNLELGLGDAVKVIAPGGRLAVISYHSLEDRIVKSFMSLEAAGCVCPPQAPICTCEHQPTVSIVNRRVIRPAPEEIEANPRSRSARMRVVQRL